MNQQQQQYYHQISLLVSNHLTPVLVGKLEGHVLLIEEARNALTNYYIQMDQEESKVEVLEMVRKMKTLKESLAKSVNGISVINDDADLDTDFDEYFKELQAYADTLPEFLLEDQSLDRFQPFTGESVKIKLGKKIKKWALMLGWVPQRLANWFREKRGKQPVSLKPWKHHIPLRGMIIYHFRDLLVEQLIDMVQAINREIAASTYELYVVEVALDQKFAGVIGEEENEDISIEKPEVHENSIDQILSKIKELSDSIIGITDNRIERIFGVFQTNYEMVGTIELSVKNFETSGLEAAHRLAIKAYRKTMDGWRNTLAVLSDRYNFDHELFKTRFTNLEQYLFVSQKLERRISEKMLAEIAEISKFLEGKQQQLSTASSEDEGFKKLLKEVRFDTSRYLKQTIPDCIHLIRKQDVPSLLENLESKTRIQVAQLSETRSMVKNISYEHAIKESEINKIAPKELITFEALPEYLTTIQSLSEEVSEVLETTQQQLMEISNICDFNLETALAAMDDESQHDKAKSMSIEGIERAYSRLQDIVEKLKNLAIKGDSVIHQGVRDFNDRIMALNEIDQVFDTQVRIAKAKALEKTKAIRARFVGQFKQSIPQLVTNLRRRGLMIYKQYRDASQKYGIANPINVLSAEISGFLADTEKTVKNLPFVYQRLFELSPLDNLFFYEPRPVATIGLKKAYENWKAGHFGATVLIAEAGSGVTTLIYFFLRELEAKVPVIPLGTTDQIYSRESLFQFFEKELQTSGLGDTDALVNYLNQLEGRRIIVLEDLEHFFIRKVNGFDAISLFIEVVNRTNENIFWLATVNEYSYQYLVKTVNIDDYFSYNIKLRPLRPAQVTSLVLKRHRVSGFSIVFRPHKLDRKNNRFKKMNEEERQEYLEKEYFNNLNRIAQSNITLALVYWIRSIKEIEEDVMYIRSISAINYSFLLKLSDEKLFTLHSMLLHDGISISDHSKIFQHSLKESKLAILPLFDDGIIIHKDGRFFINPLLFRQIVNLLKDKNILH